MFFIFFSVKSWMIFETFFINKNFSSVNSISFYIDVVFFLKNLLDFIFFKDCSSFFLKREISLIRRKLELFIWFKFSFFLKNVRKDLFKNMIFFFIYLFFVLLFFFLFSFFFSFFNFFFKGLLIFESGFNSIGKVKSFFSLHFFLILLIFVLFDVEFFLIIIFMWFIKGFFFLFYLVFLCIFFGFFVEWFLKKLIWFLIS